MSPMVLVFQQRMHSRLIFHVFLILVTYDSPGSRYVKSRTGPLHVDLKGILHSVLNLGNFSSRPTTI